MNIPKLVNRNEYNSLVEEKTLLLAKCQSLETEIENLKNMSKDMTEAKAENETVIAGIKAEYEKQISELKSGMQKVEVSSEEKAISILASIGVPQEELPKQTVETLTPEQLFAKWTELQKSNKTEANKLYAEHRNEFIRMVGYSPKKK